MFIATALHLKGKQELTRGTGTLAFFRFIKIVVLDRLCLTIDFKLEARV